MTDFLSTLGEFADRLRRLTQTPAPPSLQIQERAEIVPVAIVGDLRDPSYASLNGRRFALTKAITLAATNGGLAIAADSSQTNIIVRIDSIVITTDATVSTFTAVIGTVPAPVINNVGEAFWTDRADGTVVPLLSETVGAGTTFVPGTGGNIAQHRLTANAPLVLTGLEWSLLPGAFQAWNTGGGPTATIQVTWFGRIITQLG